MCGIVAVLARPSGRPVPKGGDLLARMDAAAAAMGGLDRLAEAAVLVEAVDAALRGVPGVRALVGEAPLARALHDACEQVDARVGAIEAGLDAGEPSVGADQLESVNASLVRLRDASWAIRCDRLRHAAAVAALAGAQPISGGAWEGYAAIQVALSALDRLEVRGRDSAGIQVLVEGHDLDVETTDVRRLLEGRTGNRLLTSGAVRVVGAGRLAFFYKTAVEIGDLGDNIRVLRRQVAADELLSQALAAPSAQATVLGHTRWASVGVISEPNAHPLTQEEDGATAPGPHVAAALNGDVDNHAELRSVEGLTLPPEITTDAKVIPVLVSRRLAAGDDAAGAFAATLPRLAGSVAVASTIGDAPGRLFLGVRGSGQALYVGFADDAFVVASEPYGLVEEARRYLRLDGDSTGGQIVILDRAGGGSVAGATRCAYDGTSRPVADSELMTAGITTRDIDRGGYPHFFLKEISQAPDSFRKTLRGKVADGQGRLRVSLPQEALPDHVRDRLAAGKLTRVFAIGQGTAAVAAQVLADTLNQATGRGRALRAIAMPGTELSGFSLDDDMSDALVIAVSQSGTTADTNRTVDLVRGRGATVLCIVNRRNSDLTDRADGVLYTSDGRDVEMSVASTKAFYAQVAAGMLLALGIAAEAGSGSPREAAELLGALRELPAGMERVLELRPAIAAAARDHAPSRRHWAVVGSGPNRFAAAELRLKLSELAYKAVACDSTEDKKHIDLCSEPLILVCAAGLPPGAASDLAKELAIFRAHKAAAVVLVTEGFQYPQAAATIPLPAAHPRLAFVLAAMAGHLFGYEAALSIEAQGRALREARAAVEAVAQRSSDPYTVMARLAGALAPHSERFHSSLRAGAYNGSLEAGTASQLSSLLRYATGVLPLDCYELEHGRVGTPGTLLVDLLDALSAAVDELTRPIDAIKHQAKTVTVGISRPEEDLFASPLAVATLAAGPPRDRLSYRVLRTLAALGPAVVGVTGHTRYLFEGPLDEGGPPTLRVLSKGGVAEGIRSRAELEDRPVLRGTKHRAATLREVTVARGATDGRTVIIVPETQAGSVVGITLLHARFASTLSGVEMRAVLDGYQARYGALVDAVTETEAAFDDTVLGTIPPIDLLTSPVHVLAVHWRN